MIPDRSHSDTVGRVANKVKVEGGKAPFNPSTFRNIALLAHFQRQRFFFLSLNRSLIFKFYTLRASMSFISPKKKKNKYIIFIKFVSYECKNCGCTWINDVFYISVGDYSVGLRTFARLSRLIIGWVTMKFSRGTLAYQRGVRVAKSLSGQKMVLLHENVVEGPPFWEYWRDSKEIAGSPLSCRRNCIQKNFPAVENEVRPVHCSAGVLLKGWW